MPLVYSTNGFLFQKSFDKLHCNHTEYLIVFCIFLYLFIFFSVFIWNRHVLKDILENIAYIGHLAQGKSSSSLHQGIAFHRTSEDEWDIVRNTHEAIISDELWEKVQTVNKESADKATRNKGRYDNLPKVDNLFGKKLVCADCGRVIKLCRSISTKKDKAY